MAELIPASWGSDAATLGLFLAGIVLWLVGGRLMKAASIVTFALVGATVGFAAPAEFSLDLHPFLTAGLGLILGAFGGALLFRFSMAATLSLALCLAVATVVGVTRDLPARAPDALRPIETSQLLAPATNDPTVFISRSATPDDSARTGSASSSAFEHAVDRVVRVGIASADEAEQRWNLLEADDRQALRLAALAGAVFGFGLGLMAPLFAASVVTSAAGVGLALATGASLAVAHELPFVDRLPETMPAWAVLWLLLTAIGALLQCAPSRSKRPSRCAKRPPAGENGAAPAA